MEPAHAAEHLQVIRTLMERSALYRRALAPITTFAGVVGLLAAGVGWGFCGGRFLSFILYWYAVGAVVLAGSFALVRRQAFQQNEPFWSPPTRRVAQAMLPPLTAGFFLGIAVLLLPSDGTQTGLLHRMLPSGWVILYGCAVHAAGFYTTRGMRLFGWLLILGGSASLFVGRLQFEQGLTHGHLVMGMFFGACHLAYGAYLYFTEPRRNET